MDTKEDKPKVRIVKAGGQRLKSGLIRVEGEKGTVYRGPCDRCHTIVTTSRPPVVDRELLCHDCTYVARVGKPSTKVKRKDDKVLGYSTECDICGDREKTPFLPKKSRPFLCDLCYQETDESKNAKLEKEKRREHYQAERQAERQAEEQTEKQAEKQAARRTVPQEKLSDQPWKTLRAPEFANRTHTLICKRCRARVDQKFKPGPGEVFICRDCHVKEQEQARKAGERPTTRLIFNIECVVCGKSETVDFVPKSLSEPICTECFDKIRRK